MSIGEPNFILPRLEHVPFDDLLGEILIALERHNWQVPGVKVQFLTSADGTYRFVRSIKGDDFLIGFTSPQTGGVVRSLAVTELAIPRKCLLVGQSQTLYLSVYAGEAWASDAAAFFEPRYVSHALRVVYTGRLEAGAKFELEPRQSRGPHMERMAPSYTMGIIFTEFRHWLQERILRLIQAAPVVDHPLRLDDEAPQKVPKGFEYALTLGTAQEANRVCRGRDILATPYALAGGNWVFETEGDQRRNFYENFRPALPGLVLPTTDPRSLHLPSLFTRRGWHYMFRLRLKRANGIFVRESDADQSVPLIEYDGSYRHPMLLLGRSLDDDEVDLISGPWPYFELLRRIRTHNELKYLFGQLLSIRAGTPELDEQLRQFNTYLNQDEGLRLAAQACSPDFQDSGLSMTLWYELVTAWKAARTYGLLE